MNRNEIGVNAGKVWQLLSNNEKWSYGLLKRKSGLKDKELGAALGWLSRESKIEFDQCDEELYVYLCVEGELLKKVVPVDPISQFIHLFSSSHTVAFFVILALFGMGYLYRAVRKKRLQLIWFNDIDSIFPNILTLLMATAATLYSSIQHFVPDIWERFYYNPSLNPLDLPFILSLFMFNVWGIVLVGLATLDDLFHQVRVEAAFFYLLGLMSCCIFLYLFFTFTAYYYIGYPCLVLYAVWVFRSIKRTSHYKFSCGNCGAKMKSKGTCPHCGAINE